MSELFWQAADFRRVWDSPLTTIHRLKYCAEQPCASGRETFVGQAFFFYEQGFFELKLQNQSHLIDPTCIIFNNHGDEWVVSLPAHTEIRCTEIVPRHVVLQELIAETARLSPDNINQGHLAIKSRAGTSAEINRLHQQLLIELSQKSVGSSLLIDSIATTMCVLALRQFTTNGVSAPSLPAKNGDLELEKIERAKRYLSERLTQDVSLTEVAQSSEVSPYHFIRLFKKLTGQTPHQYLSNLRVNQAKMLLAETSQGVTEIAVRLGYSNPSHFSALFKRNVGLTPQDFRKSAGR